MKIQDLFTADVTRDIPPVVYFHEQSPEKLQAEVAEYIITGGYPETDPRARRLKSGIHEQLVHLLRAIVTELQKKGGPELPASWISGFYGSGKSSFAKLLGLALDGVKLPNGKPLAEALLARDESPLQKDLVDAWTALQKRIDPTVAVVFDIGGVARDDEHVHAAALRQVQAKLGYCSRSHLVAEYELKLERDGDWERFEALSRETLGKPWSVAKDELQADDQFSHVMHALYPKRFVEPTSWIDSRAGARTGIGTSVSEAVESIEAMLSMRAEGKTLCLVVDEVSQYIHQHEERMLKLQSFVSELGQKLKGAAWLFATGQQKLEDASEADNIGKLKGRFPPQLRVHLHPSNIRDVVHRRLLAKRADKEKLLRELFQKHRSDLQLYGYQREEAEGITEEDFLEIYPMLPGHIELLMDITSNLRTRSPRTQGDDHAIRGLLQLLGELFRECRLGEREVGDLVTLDEIFEVQQSALEADIQTTLTRIFAHPDVRDDLLAQRAAKAVALLELIQEQQPTTAELVARCLYQRLGQGNQAQAVSQALEKLRAANLVAYSEKHGYKIQSSAGQEWERERNDIGVTLDQISETVCAKVKELLGTPDRPRYKGRPFPFAAFFSDGRHLSEERVQDARDESTVVVDFRYVRAREDRASAAWVQKSDQSVMKDRLVWVVGDPGGLDSIVREYARSLHMKTRFASRRESLGREKQRLLLEEEARLDDLEKKALDAVAEAFLDGTLFFRGRTLEPRTLGASFGIALNAAGTRVLPDLYPHLTEIAVTDSELNQLLEPTLAGPSTKFMEEGGLGILSLDAGKYVPTCAGAEPSRILQFIEQSGASGATLMQHFRGPPYGYPQDVVRACLAGLLRAGKIRIRPEEGPEITSIRDPGTRDLFRKALDLRRADVFPAKEGAITPRDKVQIRKFFENHLGLSLDQENDAFADAVYQQFPGRRERLREVEARFDRLPGRPPLPPALVKLGKALEECRRSRQVEETVIALKKNLGALADGLEQLGILQSELTDQAIDAVVAAGEVRDVQLAQLEQVEALGGLDDDARTVRDQLAAERMWRGVSQLEGPLTRIRARYVEARRTLLNRQNAEAEEVRRQVKARTGFEKLASEQAHQVLRPIAEALYDTTPEAVAPSLPEISSRFPKRLADAEDTANDQLDELLAKLTEAQVVKVEANLRGREVKNREELKRLLAELEERIGAQLDRGARIRIV
jgi:hypothetical protein